MKAPFSSWVALSAAVFFSSVIVLLPARADIPDRDRAPRAVPVTPSVSGIYQVVASTDSFFLLENGAEWFLDFGKGMSEGRTAGKVSVALRQNPRVRVRVLVWQVFPEHGRLLLGNQFHEGAGRAVAKADWAISSQRGDVILERNGQRVVLRRPAPDVY